MTSERSKLAFRVPANITTVHDNQLYKGHVISLSDNDAFVLTPHPVDIARQVRLRFSIGAIYCDSAGHITNVVRMGDGNGFTVNFTLVNQAYSEFIRNLGLASADRLMSLIRNIGRIEIWIGIGLFGEVAPSSASSENQLPN